VHRGRDERGFTLIELMVVVLVLAILLGIAIPTFIGARSRAQDVSAKSNLRTAVDVATVLFASGPASMDAAALVAEEPSLSYVDDPAVSSGPSTLSVKSSPLGWGAAALSSSGTCWLMAVADNGVRTVATAVASGTTCNGSAALGTLPVSGVLPVSGPSLWLDATDTSTVMASGGNVVGWNDKSTNGYNLGPSTPTSNFTNPSGLQIGGGFGGGELSTAAVSEVLVYNRILTVTERTQTEAYLGSKWAIAVSGGASAQMASGASLWLDASDASSVVQSAGNVTVWTDKSGSGHDMTATGNGITYSTSALNGHEAVVTDGAHVLATATLGSGTGTTAFLVARQTGAQSQRVMSGINNNWLLGWWGGREDQAYFDGWLSFPGTPATTTARLYSAVTGNGTAAAVWRNGTNLLASSAWQYSASGLNGRPALMSDGVSVLATPNVGTPAAGTTAFLVARQTGAQSGRVMSGFSNNWLLGWWAGLEDQAYFGGWLSNPSTSADTTARLYSAVTGNGSASLWRNGVQVANASGGYANPVGLQLGGGYGGGEYSTAAIGEVILYPRILSASERQAVESYLAGKWSVTLGS
jgi:type IV pilus assembly protein PilA